MALGTALNTSDAKDIVLALRTDNLPVVAWSEAYNIYVKQWNGSTWVSLGGNLENTPSNLAFRPALDLRSDNNPVVAWQEWNGTSHDVFVKRWTGSSWLQFTVTALDRTLSQNAWSPALVLRSDDKPVIAWDEYDGVSNNVYVRRY